jgi:hypothetical protein
VDNLDDGQKTNSLPGHRRYPEENHFYCDRKREQDWHRTERVIPTVEEAVSSFGEPPSWADLLEWITAEPPKPKIPPNNDFFIILPNDLLDDHELNGTDRDVRAKYYQYSQPKDPHMINVGATFVGEERIAKELGCKVLTVRKSTAKLAKIGWISIQKRTGKSNLTTVNYKKQKD